MSLSRHLFATIGMHAAIAAVFVIAFFLAFPSDAFAQAQGNATPGAKGFDLLDPGSWLPAASAIIANVFLNIAALIAGVAVNALDWAVHLLVFDFGLFFGNSPGLLAGWAILRDIGNILLLFGFISIGVQTILNINHFSVGKALPRLIIFAVLLNFSLFVTEAIIDTSNAVATTVYMQAETSGNTGSAIGGQSGIISIVNAAKTVSSITPRPDMEKTFIYLLLGLFLFVAAFALFAGAILLVTRAVVLVFLMVTSPIGFAGMAIPQLNKVADQWWSALIGNALFAPAYLVLILVSLKILKTLPQIEGSDASQPDLIAAVIGSTNEMGGAMILFMLTIGFLILSVIAAKQFGVMGAKFATQAAGNLTYGVPAFFGRRTIGAASNYGARAIARSKFGRSDLGRIAAGVVGFGANKSFDVRGIKSVAKTLDSTNNIGKKGIQGIIKEQAEKREHWDEEVEKQDGAYNRDLKLDADRYRKLASKARAKGKTKRADALERKAEKKEQVMLKTVAGKKEEKKKVETRRNTATGLAKQLASQSKDLSSSISKIGNSLNALHNQVLAKQKQLADEQAKAVKAAADAAAAATAAGASGPAVVMASNQARAQNAALISQVQAALAKDQAEVMNLQNELREKRARRTTVDGRTVTVRNSINHLTEEIEHLEHEIHEQEDAYANELQEMSHGILGMSAGRKAFRDAVIGIRKHHAQTPADKQFNQFMASMKAASGGGGGHAAPATPTHVPAAASSAGPTGGGHH